MMTAWQLVFASVAVTTAARYKTVQPFDLIWRVMPLSPPLQLSLGAQRFGCGTAPKALMDSCIAEIDPTPLSLLCAECLFKVIRGGGKTVESVNVDATKCLAALTVTRPGECTLFNECSTKCSTRVCRAACCRMAEECAKIVCALLRRCIAPFLTQLALVYSGECAPFCVASG